MGTRTLGSTTGPANNNQFAYYSYAGGDGLKGATTASTTDEMYIDQVFVYCGSHSGTQYFTFGVYDGSGNLLSTVGNQGPYGVGYGWNAGSWAAGSYVHISPNVGVTAAAWAPNNIQTAGLGGGGTFDFATGGPLPNPWSGSVQSGLGYMAWYMTYFPAITASPTVWHATEGSTITVNGQSFSAGIISITLNGQGVGSINVISDTQLTFVVPSGATSGNITFNSNAGSTTPGVFYVDPTYSSLSGYSGTEGSSVAFNGTGLSGVSSVTFANGASASFSIVSDTRINIVVPSNTTSGGITVHGPQATATSATFNITPYVSNISPTSGNTGAGVTITGSGFNGASSVQFNGTTASFTINSDSQISTTVPSGATTGQISVTGPGGTAYSGTFSVLSTLTSFTPTAGGVGTSVILTGSGFTGATAVKFNGTSATYTVNSDTQITTTVPNGATTGPISVTGTGGTITSSTSFVVAPGWYKAGGAVNRLKGMWYKSGGTLHAVKGAWYKSGGTLHPLK